MNGCRLLRRLSHRFANVPRGSASLHPRLYAIAPLRGLNTTFINLSRASPECSSLSAIQPGKQALFHNRPFRFNDAETHRVSAAAVWHNHMIAQDAFLPGAEAQNGGL